MRLETEERVPAVGVHADGFARLVFSTSRLKGMPRLRNVFTPSPVPGRTADELVGYIEGEDPISGRKFTDGLMDALTSPLTDEDLAGLAFSHGRSRVAATETEDALHELYFENGWTDTLPIILPTEERVAAMLKGTSHSPDEVVGSLRASDARDPWQFTVEQVAINAVMAGAQPEHLPVILTLLASGMTSRHSSISSIAFMVMVNGPIRNEIGMNSGIGALGPYSVANTAIGRAFSLASQNLQGGSVPAISYMGTIGNPFNLTNMTFAENEEDSPWEPYHVQHGFKPDESCVTIFGQFRTLVSAPSGIRSTWREQARAIFTGLRAAGGAILLLDPLAAKLLVEHEGFAKKQDLIDWIAGTSTIRGEVWWEQGMAGRFLGERARAGVEPWASYLKVGPDDQIPVNVPEDVHVIVVGGKTTPIWAVAEGMANGTPHRNFRGTTMPIDPWR
ncbi:MAG: UGSC family (seleno)protein [Acidimicrobiales bacterium]